MSDTPPFREEVQAVKSAVEDAVADLELASETHVAAREFGESGAVRVKMTAPDEWPEERP